MAIKTQTLRSEHGHCMKKHRKLTSGLETLRNNASVNNRYWYHEIENYSDTLLICAGDSWTWGDSLGSQRTDKIYGTILTNNLKCDFINVGLCGESNLVILDYAKKVYRNLKKQYTKIIFIFTLTECTRDLIGILDLEDQYNSLAGESWPKFEKLNTLNISVVENEFPGEHIVDLLKLELALRNKNTILDTLTAVEQVTVECTKNSFPKSTQIVFAKNFCKWHNKNLATLDKIWTEIIAKKGKIDPYPNDIAFLTNLIGADRLIDYNKVYNRIPNFKNEIINEIEKAELAFDWLENSPYNGSVATRHPLEKGHEWWAEYLLSAIRRS